MKSRFQFFLICLIFLAIIFRVVFLDLHGFWLDEADHFWAAKGVQGVYLEHFDSREKDVTLPGLIKDTYLRGLGSPTFTIFIHYWSKVSNSVSWLKIVPLFFGILTLLLMYHIAIGCGFSKKWALAILTYCAWNVPWFYYSVELRSYSFEIFCSALTLALLLKILKSKGNSMKYYIWLFLSMLLGISSGYGYSTYFLFIAVFLIFYTLKNDMCIKNRKIFQLLILTIPAIIVLYCIIIFVYCVYFAGHDWFQAHYLVYLDQYLKNASGLVWFFKAVSMVMRTISFQLFCVKKTFFTTKGFILPLGLPFGIISALFLIYSIYILLLSIKKKNIIEGTILAIFIYSIAICTLLSTLGIFPIGPTRHNLFFSPVVIMSFFICIKHIYAVIKKSSLKVKENFLLAFLLVFLLIPNIRCYPKMVAELETRELLRN